MISLGNLFDTKIKRLITPIRLLTFKAYKRESIGGFCVFVCFEFPGINRIIKVKQGKNGNNWVEKITTNLCFLDQYDKDFRILKIFFKLVHIGNIDRKYL